MQKRFICFVCYKFHPEMRGVSEKEFDMGNNVCTEEKCVQKGKMLEPALYCEECDMILPFASGHEHK